MPTQKKQTHGMASPLSCTAAAAQYVCT
jgi:hypothetical protein